MEGKQKRIMKKISNVPTGVSVALYNFHTDFQIFRKFQRLI